MSQKKSPMLVMIHGLLSTPQEFALLLNPLKSMGISFVSLHIPEFSDKSHRQPNSWRDWIESAEAAIARSVPSDREIVIAGLCIGGVLASQLVLRNPKRIKGLVMLSPTFVYDGWGLSRWRQWRHLGYALGLSRYIYVAEREPFGIKNPKIRKRVAAQMLDRGQSTAGPARLPLWAIREGERMMAHVYAQLDQLRLPTLVIHAREDEICTVASVERLFRQLPSTKKRLVILENSYHMITIDNDRLRVAKELADFTIDMASYGSVENIQKAATAFLPTNGLNLPTYLSDHHVKHH